MNGWEEFDLAYRNVTARLASFAQNFDASSIERSWIDALICDFNAERNAWDGNASLNAYFSFVKNMRLSIYRLAACVYLHIGRDLPVVLLKDWPGQGRFTSLTESSALCIYDDIGDEIIESIGNNLRSKQIVGIIGVVGARLLGGTTLFDSWVLRLRYSAWVLARKMHEMPDDKKNTTLALLNIAVTNSISKACQLRPGSIFMNPPDVNAHRNVFMSSSVAATVGVGNFISDNANEIIQLFSSIVLFFTAIVGYKTLKNQSAMIKYVNDEKRINQIDYKNEDKDIYGIVEFIDNIEIFHMQQLRYISKEDANQEGLIKVCDDVIINLKERFV